MKTYQEFINESINLDSKDLNLLSKFVIQLWQDTLYLNYSNLPKGPVNITEEFLEEAKNLLELIKDGDENEDEIEEFMDWANEGMSMGGKKLLNQNIVDYLLENANKPLKKELIVYRTTYWERNQDNWMSFTTSKKPFHEENDEIKQKKFVLPIGFKVVDCKDGYEIIISLDEMKKYKFL